jgi:hypothetical protein
LQWLRLGFDSLKQYIRGYLSGEMKKEFYIVLEILNGMVITISVWDEKHDNY